MSVDIQACAQIVEKGDPDRFLSAMAAPVAVRSRLFPLYAFNVEVARAPWLTEEPMIAEMRLQWWRDGLETIENRDTPLTHEVMAPLAALVRQKTLPVVLLDQMVAARRWDIYREPFEDAAHFHEYLDRTSGHVMWLSAKALGAGDHLETPVRTVGQAMGLANWLLAVPKLEAAGRLPLPDGRPASIAELARQGLAKLQAVRSVDFGPAIPALRAAWLTRGLLQQVVKSPGCVADGQLGVSEMSKKVRLLQKSMSGRW